MNLQAYTMQDVAIFLFVCVAVFLLCMFSPWSTDDE